MIDLSARIDAEELMDDPDVCQEELSAALGELEFIQQALGGYRPSFAGILQLLAPGCREFTLLDVGTGSGDFPRRLAAWAARRGLGVHIEGIDLSPIAVEEAKEKSHAFANISFTSCDLFDLPAGNLYDIVHSTLVLHHFNGESAARALQKMHALARRGVVVNDLHRHPAAYYAILALTRAFSRNRLILNDAPLSVRRGFLRRELQEMASSLRLPAPRIRWRWAYRWQVVIPAGDNDAQR